MSQPSEGELREGLRQLAAQAGPPPDVIVGARRRVRRRRQRALSGFAATGLLAVGAIAFAIPALHRSPDGSQVSLQPAAPSAPLTDEGPQEVPPLQDFVTALNAAALQRQGADTQLAALLCCGLNARTAEIGYLSQAQTGLSILNHSPLGSTDPQMVHMTLLRAGPLDGKPLLTLQLTVTYIRQGGAWKVTGVHPSPP